MFNAKQQTLSNGIKLTTVKRDSELTAIHMGIKIGPLYEGMKEKGISHFIEHMLFKGTKNRSNEQLNAELEERAGEYNAYTDLDCTVYSITALKDETERSIELLGDMLMNATFPQDEIDKERSVILAEIRSSNDDVEDISFRKVNEIAFEESPLKYNTLGMEKTVKGFNKKQLMNFYQTYYVPNNCYISVASPYEHEEILRLVDKYFNGWLWKEFKRCKVAVEKNIPVSKATYKKNIEQCTIAYLYTFHDLDKNDELALKILNHKLGESANSILFREVREKRGLAYDIYTDLDLSKYVKTLIIYTAVGEDDVDEACNAIEDCINGIKDESIHIDENTVVLMKKVLRTAVAFTIEDCTDLSNYILHQNMDGDDIYQFIQDMKELESIKRDQIYDVARKVLNDPTVHILKNRCV